MTDNGTVLAMKQQADVMIYSSVVIEAIHATFEQTREIIETGAATGVGRESIGKILNIKQAWEYLLTNYRDEPSWDTYSDYNRLIGEGCVEDAGTLRAPGSVIVGTGMQDPYIPPPVSGEDDFNRILDTAKGSFTDIDDAAAALFLMLCRAQFFHDGNKRSAQLFGQPSLGARGRRMRPLRPPRKEGRPVEYPRRLLHGSPLPRRRRVRHLRSRYPQG